VHGHGGAGDGIDEAQIAGGAHLAAADAEEVEVGGEEVEAGGGLGVVAVWSLGVKHVGAKPSAPVEPAVRRSKASEQ